MDQFKEILDRLERIERYSLLSAKNVLCLEDVAMLTGLSKSYLYKLTSSNLIPYYRPNGKTIFFDRSEIESWMKQNRVSTAQEIDQAANEYILKNTDKMGYKPKKKRF